MTHFKMSAEASKKYCLTKYVLDNKQAQVRKTLQTELKDLAQHYLDWGISQRNIDNNRVIYEKMIDAEDFKSPSDKQPSNQEKAEEIYQLIINGFDNKNSRNIRAFTDNYIVVKEHIIAYYVRFFEIKEQIKALKNECNEKINEIVQDAVLDGIPKAILTYTYTRLKEDLKVIKEECNLEGAVDYYDNLYREIRNELMEKLQNV